ncbi:type I-F CRISPR-associated helicase Cas3f [Craterilacuibacter sinensis]|uniref:Type I-F CRISPR-associated helicase Cas3 n=1 Tax=Craterilacuibacter sinensis TaxID=2686017 RepID=A0A845BKP4_9NEIS|nr:type I-F CRISPR-associated helicase Cas3f [Craterilacuibacter sinensis]MXR37227.1 type I-F CRISPR-associated helicase Cas3 [Craterilacuibacter sinensis]
MNILLVSQCDKRALTETRRILDQFAERKGDRVWQTPITQAGLDTLRKLLRKTARKNTAVACHWLRGRDHSELMWIVGDARRFNSLGSVPTNTTQSDILRDHDENDWLTGEDIRLVATLAALFHDLGKACAVFQTRLRDKGPHPTNVYRHEWVSLRLVQAFVGQDDDAGWLARLQEPTQMTTANWEKRLKLATLRDGADTQARDNKPFADGVLPPLAAAVCWLVLSHHRLPVSNDETLTAARIDTGLRDLNSKWNQPFDSVTSKDAKPYWQFPYGLPCDDKLWCERVADIARQLAARQSVTTMWLDQPYPLHLARLTLMLADHHFSSQTVKQGWQMGKEGETAFANTLSHAQKNGPKYKGRQFNQTLPEHLNGVARHALSTARALPGIARALPPLGRHPLLQKRSADPRFAWQDKAYDLAASLRERAAAHGAFIVNMASTGCGKTLANARIMYALARPDTGFRCAFALGLRTLTLQTGHAFRDKLKLGEDQLAIRVGGAASRELFEQQAKDAEAAAEATGSASTEALLGEDSAIHFEGNPDHPLLQQLSHDPRFNALLAAPLLVCTIDHLTPATEGTRGGRQIAPMLRLLSSDLVLDEPDDFSVEDMPALTRLVYWAGLLGSRVLLSSATLPPALVKCLFDAWLAGRAQYQQHRGQPGLPLDVCCLWVDENGSHAANCGDSASFAAQHLAFARSRSDWLASQKPRRTAALLPLTGVPRDEKNLFEPLASLLREQAWQLHAANHDCDPHTGKRVSIGLIRLAHIDKIYPLARALYAQDAPDGSRIHLCVYHSQYPLLLRSAIERRLDAALTRHNKAALFSLPDIRAKLDGSTAEDHLFIVLSSPVSEVGRDHSYSWAIAEPSSMRSLIQLSGRVRRHWPEDYHVQNLLILQHSLAAWLGQRLAYCRPGFESGEFSLQCHDLAAILPESDYRHPDARPRLLPRADLQPEYRLVDLEHARLAADLNQTHTPAQRRGKSAQARLCAASCWAMPRASLHGTLQKKQPFRQSHGEEWEMVLLPDGEGGISLKRREEGDKKWEVRESDNNHLIHPISDGELLTGQDIRPWGNEDYQVELTNLATALDMDDTTCARRYGGFSLRVDSNNLQGWHFHPALGFCQKRD